LSRNLLGRRKNTGFMSLRNFCAGTYLNLNTISDFSFENPKTKQFAEVLSALKISDSRTLMVFPETNLNVVLSARNLPKAKVTRASELNTYEILRARNLVLTESSIGEIVKSLGK